MDKIIIQGKKPLSGEVPIGGAKNAALETGKLLLDHFQTNDRKGFLKSDRTMVTEADLVADKKIQVNF